VPPEGDAPEPQLPLYIAEAALAQVPRTRRPGRGRARGQDQGLRAAPPCCATRVRAALSLLRQPLDRARAAELELGAPRDRLPLPSDGPAPGARHLPHHAHRDVEDEPRLRIVGLAEAHRLRVQLRAHLARQDVRPAHVGRLPQLPQTPGDEPLRELRAGEEAAHRAPTLARVAPPRQGGDVAEARGLALHAREDLEAEAARPGVEAGLPVPLPMGAPTLARAVEAATVVAAFVAAVGLRGAGAVGALAVATADGTILAGLGAAEGDAPLATGTPLGRAFAPASLDWRIREGKRG
jgi:hypothetical protein